MMRASGHGVPDDAAEEADLHRERERALCEVGLGRGVERQEGVEEREEVRVDVCWKIY